MQIEVIWSAYQASLKAFLYKQVSNRADVEDLLQEILIKTYQNLNKVKDPKKIKSWLFQIANRTIIDFYRKRAKVSYAVDSVPWYEQEDEDMFQQFSRCIIPFINSLPKNDAELLTAIEIDGVSQKSYAARKEIKYSTLKSRVKKARQRLYGLFQDCCEFSIDTKGNLIDYSVKNRSCSGC